MRLQVESSALSGGDTLRGEVMIDTVTPCDKVILRLWWAARGADADTDWVQVVEEVVLHQGALSTGPLPFSLTVPSDPLSHAGKLVQVRWSLTARLKPPRGKDIKVTEPLVLRPGPLPAGDRRAVEAPWRARVAQQQRRRWLHGVAFLLALLAVTVPTAMAVAGLALFLPLSGLGMLPQLAPVLVLAVGMVGLAAALAAAWWWQRGRRRTLRPSLPPVAFGERIEAELEGVEGWALVCVEEAAHLEHRFRRSGGKHTLTHWREHTTVLAEGRGSTVSVEVPVGPSILRTDGRWIRYALRVGEGEEDEVPVVVLPYVQQGAGR